MTTAPMPLEWHPFYRDKMFLLDWLEGRSHFHDPTVRVPVLRRSAVFATSDEAPSDAAAVHVITLTKHRAGGPAPYVGRPFGYAWPFATDDLGRAIAGEARIVYLDGMG